METQLRLLRDLLAASDKAYLRLKEVIRSSAPGFAKSDSQDLRHAALLVRNVGVCLSELCHKLDTAEHSEVLESEGGCDPNLISRFRDALDFGGRIRERLGGERLAGTIGNLTQFLAVVVCALTRDDLLGTFRALSQPDQAAVSLDPYEQQLVFTTLHWLRELGHHELDGWQLCEGIAVFLSTGAQSLADVRTVTEEELLRVCGGLVRRTEDGAGIELATSNNRLDLRSTRPSDAWYEIAIACLRMLNFQEFDRTPGEYWLEHALADSRDNANPFYWYAAVAWMVVLPDGRGNVTLEQELTDEACRLLSSTGNLMTWLVEVGKRRLAAIYSLSPAQTFISLTTLCSKRRPSPAHIAACFGLGYACIALVDRDSEADSTRSEEVVTLLYCALKGPALLLGSVLDFNWEVSRKNFWLGPCLDMVQKLAVLLEVDGAPPTCDIEAQPSLMAVALMAFAARSAPGDAEVFRSLFPADWWSDKDFIATLQDHTFPFESSSKSDDGDTTLRRQKCFLNELCNSLADDSWGKMMSVWRAAWTKAVEYDLQCSWPSTRRRVSATDEDFTRWMLHAMGRRSVSQIRFLMQDHRWDSNLPLRNVAEEERGRTLLHQAVEDGVTGLVKVLLEHGGADVSVADVSGRTALHLCTTREILELLYESGADLRQADNDGRLLWHYAAANNDVKLLQALRKLDPDKEWVLKQTTTQGRTPLAEAFAYVRELNGLATVPRGAYKTFLEGQMQSIHFILDWLRSPRTFKRDPEYLCSDVPVVCLAAEWGDATIVRRLRKMFGRLDLVTKDLSGPLHFLNFASSADLVRELLQVPGVAELPVIDRHGRSPAETVFLAFKPSIDEPNDNAHPSNNAELAHSAYDAILTEAVCRSRDEQGRTLWERFCRDIILRYACEPQSCYVGDSMRTAVYAMAGKGVIQDYECVTGLCAFEELSKLLWHESGLDHIPDWLAFVYLQLLRVTSRAQRLKDAPRLFLRLSEPATPGNVVLYKMVVARLIGMGVSKEKIVGRCSGR